MSRAALLRIVADRNAGTWLLPSSIDGLAEPHTPSLYFHDATPEDIAPWLKRFGAQKRGSKEFKGFLGTRDFVVTWWSGELLGTTVEVRLYEEKK